MSPNLKATAGRVRRAVISKSRRGNRLSRWFYYSTYGDAFTRERELVASGHREHHRSVSSGEQVFLLRRNIHMLEKGLTMRPRRAVFGLDYIQETVVLFRALRRSAPSALSASEEGWAQGVLEQYFSATQAAKHPKVQAARAMFDETPVSNSELIRSGPHGPRLEPSPVTIEALIALAKRRKSIRWYSKKPVDRVFVDAALEVARQAPSACNRQPFRFRIFDDPVAVQDVASIPMGTAGYGQSLPAIAVIVGDTSAFSDERDRHLIYTDGCLAAMGFILGLETQGISSVCINWPDIAERDRKMSSYLGLRPFERVVMLVGFGYADETGLTPHSEKRALEDIRRFN